ncbi:MAG TPA: hypothetical protein VGO11_02525 [Chthoniobacteraceae bacterium]|jgi:hypothetical protein|nr:hypothetical protein [Chthoniobacteraceae bacterium]
MNGNGPRPSLVKRELWLTRRAHYIAVFDRALLLLRERSELPVSERMLVRELHFTTVTARRALDPNGLYERPMFETQNLPDPDSEELEPFEDKRPDIQWIHDDEGAADDRHREKSFAIECKRLGGKTQSGWDLNLQYVTGGVRRFRSPLSRYGNHMSGGMMIGFVQDMELPDVLGAVNTHLANESVAHLRLEGDFAANGVSKLGHSFERTFPQSPFHLIHRWLDIRAVPRKAAPSPKPKRARSRRRQ